MSYGLYIYFFYFYFFFFFFNDTATTEIYTLSLHDALPISAAIREQIFHHLARAQDEAGLVVLEIHAERRVEHAVQRSEEHTSELQSRRDLVCRLLLEKKKKKKRMHVIANNVKHSVIVDMIG